MPEQSDYARIEEAIRYIEENSGSQPSLEEVAARLGLSLFHFQRLFKRWAGISPKRFLQYLTVEGAKRLLDQSATVLDAALELGLSGPSRLHDLFVSTEGLSPGEYKDSGKGLRLRWSIRESPFGPCLIGLSPRGVCALDFLDPGEGSAKALASLGERWPGAILVHDPEAGKEVLDSLFGLRGSAGPAGFGEARRDLPALHLKGTNFQIKVWKALLSIPEGRLMSYGRLAQLVGAPGSARAVGSALGQNPVAVLIPCHRVLRSTGELGGYRWGPERKRALIAWEACRSAPAED